MILTDHRKLNLAMVRRLDLSGSWERVAWWVSLQFSDVRLPGGPSVVQCSVLPTASPALRFPFCVASPWLAVSVTTEFETLWSWLAVSVTIEFETLWPWELAPNRLRSIEICHQMTTKAYLSAIFVPTEEHFGLNVPFKGWHWEVGPAEDAGRSQGSSCIKRSIQTEKRLSSERSLK